MISIQDFFDEKVRLPSPNMSDCGPFRFLPSPPAVALKILEAIRKDENSFTELAQVISSDPALAARILKVANSSLYRLPYPADNLDKAMSVLGMDVLKNIALSFVIIQDLSDHSRGGFNLDVFWRRALTAAVGAEVLAKHLNVPNRDLFVTALLQDIGVLVMFLSDPAAYTRVLDEKRLSDRPTYQVEERVFGFNHTEVGGHLLQIWGLPETIYTPISCHHSVDDEPGPWRDTVAVLQFGDKVSSVYHGMRSNQKSFEIHEDLAKNFNLDDDVAEQLIDAVGEKSAEILSLFSIDSGNLKPFSKIMQEANEELGKLNLSYEQLVLELKQAKQNAEQLAHELKRANEHLQEMAFRDGLTTLYNHRYFQEMLETELDRARRYGHPVSLLMLDLDFFKKINDQYGHPIGDTVLKKVATVIQKLVRRCDIPARYGGEEFAVILPETASNGAKVLAQRLRRGVELENILASKVRVKVTVSVGFATFDPEIHPFSRSDLIDMADRALYMAKKMGRNRICHQEAGQWQMAAQI